MKISRSERFYRPIRLAGVTSLGVFGVLATVYGVTGLGGGPWALGSLGVMGIGAGIVTFFQVRRRFSNTTESLTPIGSHAEQLGNIFRRELGSNYGAAFDELIDGYRTDISRLQDVLRGCSITAEQSVIVLASGPIKCVETSTPAQAALPDYPGRFLIDPILVTNRGFEEFLQANAEWQSDVVAARYGVPYFLSEFVEGRAPADKWDHPVVWVSWYAAAAYCNWRSKRSGLRQVYTFNEHESVISDLTANGWRLPTVAEWESVAGDGGTVSRLLDPQRVNFGLHYRGTTPVARFLPFPPGRLLVYDILGNVKQWCQDADMQRPSNRRFKGASWMDPAQLVRVDRTGSLPPQNTNPDFGFRCARVPSEQEAAP